MRLSLCLAPTISIHALCEEGDFWLVIGHHLLTISIHALCEEGDVIDVHITVIHDRFLSTPSARRATHLDVICKCFFSISIHALCEEGDPASVGHAAAVSRFLSTPSARRATYFAACRSSLYAISIHALCEEGDPRSVIPLSAGMYFYPRPLRGGRPSLFMGGTASAKFLSTPSARRATK